MLAALARHRALTRDQLTGLFFGSKRRCQAALSRLKQPELVRHVIICRTVIPSRHCDVVQIAQSSAEFTGVAVSVAVNRDAFGEPGGKIVFERWRRVRDSNPRWRFCRPLPYHLANSPGGANRIV